jgi:hypothetical protein
MKVWPPINQGGSSLPPEPPSEWLEELINEAWPDNGVFWDKKGRCGDLCRSPEAHDWQCGSFGPRTWSDRPRYCHRLRGHDGKCSDLLPEEDRQTITKRLDALKKEEFEEVLGRQVRDTASRRLNMEKLREVLREGQE